MGHGQLPGVDLDGSATIDVGTAPRAEAPPPGPIGLDAKGGTSKGSDPSLADRILSFIRRRQGERVGDGECFALADSALRSADARSAADYGTITAHADYVWGRAVTLADLQPGDVIQFRNYRYEREIVEETRDGTATRQDTQSRPHHTAIVLSVGSNGAVTVWEQNSPRRSPVVRTELFFRTGTSTEGSRTTTITVRGDVWFYRPEPR